MDSDSSPADMSFVAGGALDPSASSYITRASDREALQYLFQRRYVCILGPRQVGKTSLLNKLHAALDRAGIASAVIDLSGFPGATTGVEDSNGHDQTALQTAWYSELAEEIAYQFSSSLETVSEHVHDRASFSRFLNKLEVVANQDPGAVIMLDEAASVPESWKTEFFMLLRELYNSRPTRMAKPASRITFVFAGAFYPGKLVTNPNVSPFNVSQEIYVPDLTHDEVVGLLRGFAREGIALDPEAAEQIWDMARGHPFLTQKLCATLLSQARAHVSEQGSEGWPRSVTSAQVHDSARSIGARDAHFMHLVRLLDRSPAEVELIRRVVIDGEMVPFNPLVSNVAAQLEMSGALSEDHGYARVRNPIYGRTLRDYLSART